MPRVRARRLGALLGVAPWLASLACGAGGAQESRTAAPLSRAELTASRAQVDTIAPGLVYTLYRVARGPLVIHAIEADLEHCWRPVALKVRPGAEGTERTSVLVTRAGAWAGINGDYFTARGIPTGPYVSGGVVTTGPTGQADFVVDSVGIPRIARLHAVAALALGRDSVSIDFWNRAAPFGLSVFDERWGARTDSVAGSVRVVVGGRRRSPVLSVDTIGATSAIPAGGFVLVAGPSVGDTTREKLLALRPQTDSVSIANISLVPYNPREAVGGIPQLVGDSTLLVTPDPGSGSQEREPHSAVGISAGGRHLLLVAVDGRQRASAGLTLPEFAVLMRELGARDALNLDGGSSTTLVARSHGAVPFIRILNHPSDWRGERPVGNVLAIVRTAGCR